MGRFFLTMMAGIAEMERNLIRDRTQAAMNYKKGRGERISRFAPFGSTFVNGRLRKVDAEQKVIHEMRELRAKGVTLQGICDRLSDLSIRTKQGGNSWKPMTVKRILDRANTT